MLPHWEAGDVTPLAPSIVVMENTMCPSIFSTFKSLQTTFPTQTPSPPPPIICHAQILRNKKQRVSCIHLYYNRRSNPHRPSPTQSQARPGTTTLPRPPQPPRHWLHPLPLLLLLAPPPPPLHRSLQLPAQRQVPPRHHPQP